jgi:DNA-directed RNA polymerase specialized sigma24 family protein
MGHAAPDRAEFHTTRWSVVLSALGPEGEAHAALQGESRTALETLCAAYWYPLYAFARRTGLGHEAAEDAIQSFFARLLEKLDWHADPLRGRFRAFLLGALRNFLAHERERARTLKRGGGEAWVSADDARLRYEREAPLSDSPEHCYERAFALALVDQSLERLQAEQQHAGKAVQFAALREWLGAAEGRAALRPARPGAPNQRGRPAGRPAPPAAARGGTDAAGRGRPGPRAGGRGRRTAGPSRGPGKVIENPVTEGGRSVRG